MTLFARNAPVLETDALAAKRVLCVGLGSGGSTVADLLARSGVGREALLEFRSCMVRLSRSCMVQLLWWWRNGRRNQIGLRPNVPRTQTNSNPAHRTNDQAITAMR